MDHTNLTENNLPSPEWDPIWCLRCGCVSQARDWPPATPCPLCNAPAVCRFRWEQVRGMQPRLPETPHIGSCYRLSG